MRVTHVVTFNTQPLRTAPQVIRSGALDVLSKWLRGYQAGVKSGSLEMVRLPEVVRDIRLQEISQILS